MKALLLALAALLASGPVAAYAPATALAAAGEAYPAGNFCGPQRLALDGTLGPDGEWAFLVSATNDYPIIPFCNWVWAFEGALDANEGGCVPQVQPFPDEFPLVLCLGPAPAVAGVLEVRLCWVGLAPCSVDEAYLAGDLLAVRG